MSLAFPNPRGSWLEAAKLLPTLAQARLTVFCFALQFMLKYEFCLYGATPCMLRVPERILHVRNITCSNTCVCMVQICKRKPPFSCGREDIFHRGPRVAYFRLHLGGLQASPQSPAAEASQGRHPTWQPRLQQTWQFASVAHLSYQVLMIRPQAISCFMLFLPLLQ